MVALEDEVERKYRCRRWWLVVKLKSLLIPDKPDLHRVVRMLALTGLIGDIIHIRANNDTKDRKPLSDTRYLLDE